MGNIYPAEELDQLVSKLETIRPKNTPEKVEDLIPLKIYNSMDSYLRKDIQELLDCYAYELWTSTCLMSFRIIEREIKNYIFSDLNGPEDIMTINQCILFLKSSNYNQKIIEILETVSIDRNEGMHGEKRFSTQEANYFLCWSIYLSVWIYNHS